MGEGAFSLQLSPKYCSVQYFSQSYKSEIFFYSGLAYFWRTPYYPFNIFRKWVADLRDNAEPEVLVLTQGIQKCRWALLSGIHPLQTTQYLVVLSGSLLHIQASVIPLSRYVGLQCSVQCHAVWHRQAFRIALCCTYLLVWDKLGWTTIKEGFPGGTHLVLMVMPVAGVCHKVKQSVSI